MKRIAPVLLLMAMSACASYAPPPIELVCKQPLNNTVSNACVVSEQTLWRGAQPDAAAAASLVDQGVKTVVSLQLLHDDRLAFEAARPATPAAREVQYFQIRNWEPFMMIAQEVVDQHVAHFMAITRSQPGPVYVHCRAGQNRTGMMVAAWRVFNGADIEQTVAEMAAYRGFWSKPVASYIRTLTPERRAAMEPMIAQAQARLQRSAHIACADGRCTFKPDAP